MNLIYSPLMVHFHLKVFQFHMHIRRGYPLSVVTVGLLCRFLLSVFSIAGFYSRDQLPCFATETKKVHMNKLDTLRMSQKHQHCCRSFVLGHQHGHRDVIRKPRKTTLTATRSQVCTLSYEKKK